MRFSHRPVNSPYEDPCVYVRMAYESRAFLFDLGNIDALTLGELLKVTDVFVTHMHIDHFIGFGALIRSQLTRDRALRVYGPEGITSCVEGHLRGYTWNLIENYPIRIRVHEALSDRVLLTEFGARERFARRELAPLPFDGTLLREPGLCVHAAHLSHGVPTLGFSMREDYRINIDRAALDRMGIATGPWLGELKRMIRSDAAPEAAIVTPEGTRTVGDLKHIALRSEGQAVSYVMDTSPSAENISAIEELVRGSHTLYCEAYFMDADLERAVEREHLTTRLAAEAAARAGVRHLVPMHFSPKYLPEKLDPASEALLIFKTLAG